MVPKAWLLAASAVLVGIVLVPRGLAQLPSQTPTPPPPPAVSKGEPDVLPGLPRPKDAPGSLFQAPSSALPYDCSPLPGPYFERDPRLDPPFLPQPGWFAELDLGVVVPHVKNRLRDMVQVGTAMPDIVQLPSTDLNWTVSPSVQLGYRLPSGFGAFAVGYRQFASDGTAAMQVPDGPAILKNRLDVNIAELDYLSWELSLWPNCGMKWWFGLRLANIFFDGQLSEPFAEAAAGSGIFATHVSNHFLGGGPLYGLQLTKDWRETGISLVARAEGATLLGRVQQDFLEFSTLPGPGGALLIGETRRSNPQSVPTLNVFLGINWQPPRYSALLLSAGYEYEYWWSVGRLSTTTSRGEMSNQGVLLKAEFRF